VSRPYPAISAAVWSGDVQPYAGHDEAHREPRKNR
jgi:hypothetical protein